MAETTSGGPLAGVRLLEVAHERAVYLLVAGVEIRERYLRAEIAEAHRKIFGLHLTEEQALDAVVVLLHVVDVELRRGRIRRGVLHAEPMSQRPACASRSHRRSSDTPRSAAGTRPTS